MVEVGKDRARVSVVEITRIRLGTGRRRYISVGQAFPKLNKRRSSQRGRSEVLWWWYSSEHGCLLRSLSWRKVIERVLPREMLKEKPTLL